MKADYVLLDPTGNMTILVKTPFPPSERPRIAAELMAREPAAEQVGFLSHEEGFDLALGMAGGEFCGNASMCAGVLAAAERGIVRGDMTLRVSGAAGPVKVRVLRCEDGSWQGRVSMPEPFSIREAELPGIGRRPLVFFDGIAHIIMEGRPDRAAAEALAPKLARFLQADAAGMMFLDPENETLTPLVSVPGAGTLCWENSCASGTAAVGAYLASKNGGSADLSLRQPGGSLAVSVRNGRTILLSGSVRILRKETVSL
ncbi:MAG: hypothetical protein K6E30_09015 [Lachnospiraceae bacterium]|nr:hypothetical protein [Lachnospiraceae bacterium]